MATKNKPKRISKRGRVNEGRPSKYDPKYCQEVDKYLKSRQDKEVQVVKQANSDKGYEMYDNKLKVQLPTIEGFASYLDISKRVLYDWRDKYPEFLHALEKIEREQQQRLIDKGLSGEYNPTIAKLVLAANHGMKEDKEAKGGDTYNFNFIKVEQTKRIARRILDGEAEESGAPDRLLNSNQSKV